MPNALCPEILVLLPSPLRRFGVGLLLLFETGPTTLKYPRTQASYIGKDNLEPSTFRVVGTPGFLNTGQAAYQLSYSPSPVLSCPVQPCPQRLPASYLSEANTGGRGV